MGCTQSTARPQPAEQQSASNTAKPEPVAEKEVAAAPVAAVAPAEAPVESAAEPVSESVAEPAAEQALVEVAVESTSTADAPVVQCAVAPVPVVEEVTMEEAAAGEAIAAEPEPAQPPQPATPTVPVLALPRKRASALAKRNGSRASSSRSTPRPQKENAATGKVAGKGTPSKPRGLGLGNTNTAHNNNVSDKKVYFDAVPAPVYDAPAQRTIKARKAAGKHGANVNEELFLASIAAFERQLTHRASLDSQLNTR